MEGLWSSWVFVGSNGAVFTCKFDLEAD